MKVKVLEVRDRATFIPVMAIRLDTDCNYQENWLLRKAGYGNTEPARNDYVYLINLEDAKCEYDPYKWADNRTMHEAHIHIADNFDSIEAGDVIDVEFILGESETKKTSERYEVN